MGSNARVPSDVKDATISFLEEMCSCAILHAKKEKSAESGAACWRFRCLFTINEAECMVWLSNYRPTILIIPLHSADLRHCYAPKR